MNPVIFPKTEPKRRKLPVSKSGWEKAISSGNVNLDTVISECKLPPEAGLLRKAYIKKVGGFPCGA